MSLSKRSFKLVIVVCSLIPVLSSCWIQKKPVQADDPKTLFFRLSSQPETLDWNKANSTIATHILLNVMEGLLHLDEQLQIVPALAESYSWSNHQKQITFKLKRDVAWSDGVPLQAQQFVDSWQRLLSPQTSAAYAS